MASDRARANYNTKRNAKREQWRRELRCHYCGSYEVGIYIRGGKWVARNACPAHYKMHVAANKKYHRDKLKTRTRKE